MSSQGKTHHLKARLFSYPPKCPSQSMGLYLHLLREELRLDSEDHKSQGRCA